jgi:ribosomal protein L37AE/L43A
MPTSSQKTRHQLQSDAAHSHFSIENGPQHEYELPREEEAFIPVEEWSQCQEIAEKGKVSNTEKTKNNLETIEDKTPDKKNCRFCSKEINSNSEKCEHCGRILTERTTKRIFV